MEHQILKKLKTLREKRGLKPMVLAEYLHIDESAYTKMENGTNHTWGKYLFSLLEYYKISPTDFFSDLEGKNFIHQEVKEIKDQAQNIGVIEKNYADKTIVKSLLNEKDKRIELQDHKIKHLEEANEKLKLDIAYLKGKLGIE